MCAGASSFGTGAHAAMGQLGCRSQNKVVTPTWSAELSHDSRSARTKVSGSDKNERHMSVIIKQLTETAVAPLREACFGSACCRFGEGLGCSSAKAAVSVVFQDRSQEKGYQVKVGCHVTPRVWCVCQQPQR